MPVINKGKAIGVINIHHRDKHEHEPEEIATISFIGEQMGSAIAKSLLEEENARLSEETAEMKRQLETRKSVERAKGILQKRHALSEEEAYLADAQREPPPAPPHERSGRRHHSFRRAQPQRQQRASQLIKRNTARDSCHLVCGLENTAQGQPDPFLSFSRREPALHGHQ